MSDEHILDSHGHVPVLMQPVLSLLAAQPGEVMLDATLGRGGHAAAIVPQLGRGGHYIGLDLDAGNLAAAGDRLRPIAEEADVRLTLEHASFADAASVLRRCGVERVDGLLADLGFASTQMDDPSRGLTFSGAGPLDMRLNQDQPLTAATLVNTLSQHDLADLIYRYGEERLSRRIARKIVEARAESPIETTAALAELVRRAYGPQGRKSRIDPATRTFMALRIAVNGELEALDALLAALPGMLATGGRAVLISFHSLEDRRVKRAFAGWREAGEAELLTRKPVVADDAERDANPRSRSAKLRALRWQGVAGTG
ncbi:16S rRNA (cytosine(1402)-N(4))-methyltransferase RsmH [Phycisphaerales bacterium AB-hyl4]|uniref:Ribosomal RNA small subunit methyltransferase H n=1 Tax=Natronomicrosphaera hydrolytica TaxID=3242702 RepID=A0ABV4U4U5_9BACT